MKKRSLLLCALLTMTLTISVPLTAHASWQSNSKGWWNTNDSKEGYSTGWDYINGNWYLFNANGWMQTGWQQVGGSWYYMNSSGAMAANQWVGNYYVGSNGAMATNTWIGSYYVNDSGRWIPGYKPASGWIKDNTGWWYKQANGSYPASEWMKDGNNWYYFQANGYIKTGWLQLDNTWYYLTDSGAMKTGWLQLGNTWYYLNDSGAMVNGSVSIGGTLHDFRSDGSWLGETVRGCSAEELMQYLESEGYIKNVGSVEGTYFFKDKETNEYLGGFYFEGNNIHYGWQNDDAAGKFRETSIAALNKLCPGRGLDIYSSQPGTSASYAGRTITTTIDAGVFHITISK